MFTSEMTIRDLCNTYSDFLDSIINCTMVDFRKVVGFRAKLEVAQHRFAEYCMTASGRMGTSDERYRVERKASAVYEAVCAASRTTFDDKVNTIWIDKLYELGLRG